MKCVTMIINLIQNDVFLSCRFVHEQGSYDAPLSKLLQYQNFKNQKKKDATTLLPPIGRLPCLKTDS